MSDRKIRKEGGELLTGLNSSETGLCGTTLHPALFRAHMNEERLSVSPCAHFSLNLISQFSRQHSEIGNSQDPRLYSNPQPHPHLLCNYCFKCITSFYIPDKLQVSSTMIFFKRTFLKSLILFISIYPVPNLVLGGMISTQYMNDEEMRGWKKQVEG